MKASIIIFALFLMLSFGSVEQVLACSCGGEQPICEAFGESKAVFVGKVIEGESPERMSDMLTRDSNDNSFKIKVIDAFAGVEKDETVTIHTGLGFGDCGFPFQKDETYLIYAYENKGRLETNICTRSSHISRTDFNEEDFNFLRKLPEKEFGAKISGSVSLYKRNEGGKIIFPFPKSQELILERLDINKNPTKIKVNRNGQYEISNLSSGNYRLSPILNKNLIVSDYETSEFWLNNKGCLIKDFLISNDSEIKGRVVDINGKPINQDIWFDLVPENPAIEPDHDILGKNGEFWFYEVPPGKYFLAINYVYAPNLERPYPKTLLKPIEIGLGQKIRNIVVKLPSELPILEIKGKVVWKDNNIAEKIELYLHDFNTQEIISNVTTDKDGNFTIKGLKGQNYYIETGFLEKNIDGKKIEFEARSAKLNLNKNINNLVLTLKKKDK